jgi:glycosyltransferase involved in cell wall biosynthesis
MKIGYLFTERKQAVVRDAGDSAHIQEMCRALGEAGHTVFVIAAERGRSSEGLTDLAVYETGRPAAAELLDRARRRMRSTGDARQYTKEAVIEASWNLRPIARDVSRIALAAAWNTWFYWRARAIISRERPDVLYERYVPFGVVGSKLAAAFRLPLVVEMNTSFTFPTEAWHHHSPLNALVARRVERYLPRYADHVIAVSRTIQEYLICNGAPPERISVLPNAADPKAFHPDPVARRAVRRAWDLDDECIVAGFLGSLKRWHGLEVLLEAAAILRNRNSRVRFVIVGDGPLAQELVNSVKQARLEAHVSFVGPVARGGAARYLSAFDIAVAPAPVLSTFYFSPLKIFEYMATGTAVVAARYPEIETIIDEGRTGLLVSPGDPEALANGIDQLAADEHLRDELGQRGREAIVTSHTWAHRAARVTRLYEQIDHDRKSAGSARGGISRNSQASSI